MRRWNGWGEVGVEFEVPDSAEEYIEARLGPGNPRKEVTLDDVISGVGPSRLPDDTLWETDSRSRVIHSVGQSIPDWIAFKGGTIPGYPDGVAQPASAGEVKELLKRAAEAGAVVIPYGGGTSVLGHLSVPDGDRPVLSVDMGRMNGLLDLDARGRLATFGAGVAGPVLEAALESHGYTLGHYPQSFEYSTLGGWVATRSSGQFSLGYGRIEQLYFGGTVITPSGELDLPVHPASAAGPDLKQLVMGSEGRLGIITDCVVKVSPLPERELFKAAFFPDEASALAAARDIAQAGLGLTMIRLSLAEETATTLSLAGDRRDLRFLGKYLAWRGVGPGKCMLLVGAVGPSKRVARSMADAMSIVKRHKGVSAGQGPGRQWYKNRFRLPYVRNTLWDRGYVADTLETAVPWRQVEAAVVDVEAALRTGLEKYEERVHVFTHLSHVYPHGSSIYTTYLFRLGATPAQTLEWWRLLKTAASGTIVRHGGTISHQHGVGLDHRPYLEAEKGALGLDAIRSALGAMDPEGMMNPGKLVD